MSDDLTRLRELAGLKPVSTNPSKSSPTLLAESRKTFADYLREAERMVEDAPVTQGMETVGQDRNSAIKSIQSRMAPGSSSQQAAKTLDTMTSAGAIKRKGSGFEMEPMDDEDFKSAIGESETEQEAQLPPDLLRFIDTNPDTVSDNVQTMLADIENHASTSQSRYAWVIARLPDGRFFNAPDPVDQTGTHTKRWKLPVVKSGSSSDFL